MRGSVVLPMQSTARAVEEIELRAGDARFVQVLMLAFGEQPLGKPVYWPIYATAERHGFAVGIHAGSSYHHAVTGRDGPPTTRRTMRRSRWASTPSSAASSPRACS